MEIKLFTDGGARGNPGPAAIGIVVKDAHGKLIKEIGKYIGVTTNNEAEYSALVQGLHHAAEHQAEKAHFFLDSELVVKQMNGLYKVKNANLKKFWQTAKDLENKISLVTYTHVTRDKNSEADALVNEVLDSKV